MLPNPDPQLTFGAVNLIGTDAELAANGYRFEALGDNATWGNPLPIDQKVISWLQDGAIIARTGYDNREMFIRVQVVGEDSNKLAVAEGLLVTEVGKANLLTWTPPDGDGEPCVFSVVMSTLEFDFNDIDEVREQRVRTYGLKIVAEPFVRAVDVITVSSPAPTVTQAITVVDDCTATTGWAWQSQPAGGSQSTGTPTVVGGTYIGKGFSDVSTAVATRIALVRTGLSQSLTGTPYIRVDVAPASQFVWTSRALGTTGPTFKLNGLDVSIAAQEGYVYWLDASSVSVTTLTSVAITIQVIGNQTTNSVTLNVADISRSNVLGTQATNRQLSRTLSIAGSARTQGSLSLADASDALGDVLVYTTPTVPGLATPNLRQFLVLSGTETPDASTVSGFNSEMNIAHRFDIPAENLQAGGHVFMARITGLTATETFVARTYSRQGSSDLLPYQPSQSVTADFTSGEYKILQFGIFNLPTHQMGSDGIVRMQIDAVSDDWLVDEAWLFNIETGRLTWVEAGAGTPAAGGPSNRLWLDAPTLANPSPGVYLGTEADRSDSFHAGAELVKFEDHQFAAGSMNVTTVTTESTTADLEFSHAPRFFTHVAAA